MADAWEESVLGVPQDSSQILSLMPFQIRQEDGSFIVADLDAIPVGRVIDSTSLKGDRFSNWEEYRGFEMSGDLDSVQYTDPKHVRLNPKYKDVLIHFRSNLEQVVKDNLPGFISSLDSVEINIVEKLMQLNETEFSRRSLSRTVNLNQYGAWFPYFGIQEVTNQPSFLSQNAVTFWRDDPREDILDPIIVIENYTAVTALKTVGPKVNLITGPKYVSRIWIRTRLLSTYPTQIAPYYQGQPQLVWDTDYDRLIKWLLGHEFGHSIAMKHLTNVDSTLMRIDVPYDITGRLFPPPDNWNHDYSATSQSDIIIRVK